MKKVLGIMFLFFLLLTVGGIVYYPLFSHTISGMDYNYKYVYPIYFGIICLAGLIVACTIIISEKIDELKEK